MPSRLIGRDVERHAVDHLLTQVPGGPCALVLSGEAGIGKTSVWLAGMATAELRGFRVLSTRAVLSESAAAYSALAELLAGVDAAVLDHLPAPQRLAIDRVLAEGDEQGPDTDQRAVAAAVRSVLERLAQSGPLLVAIDDVQWLDPPTATVLAWAARRVAGPIGFLATLRGSDEGSPARTLLEPADPERLHLVKVTPMGIGALRSMLSHHLGRAFPGVEMVWIHDVSAGNPFYALELARALTRDSAAMTSLPSTLAELVAARIAGLPDGTRDTLLAAACLAAPTVELIARAAGAAVGDTVAALEEAERHGIVRITGNRVAFEHPLLARGVYSEAPPDQLRAMHRRLAGIVADPESRARHHALAGDVADTGTVTALVEAARSARRRGAPAAAAELLDMAITLGDTDVEHRLNCAACHFESGAPHRARDLLDGLIAELPPGGLRAEVCHLLALVHMYDNDAVAGTRLLQQAVGESAGNPLRQTHMLIMLAFAMTTDADSEPALRPAEQAVAQARMLLHPGLLSRALTVRVMTRFLNGDGVDTGDLQHALDLDGDSTDVPLSVRPRMLQTLMQLWTGDFDAAEKGLARLEIQCTERGEEGERMFVRSHQCFLEVWRGNLDAADRATENAMAHARHLAADMATFVALIARAMVDAHLGRVDEARRHTASAIEVGERCHSERLMEMAIGNLAFLELSLGDPAAALTLLDPLVGGVLSRPRSTEIPTGACIPDAIEAMVEVGRVDDARRLTDLLEANGRRLDRPWMLARGGRCRALVLAATGDLAGAVTAAQQALAAHDRLAMPLELARTQLVLGTLLRRRRQREEAARAVAAAVAGFERIGAGLWATRARAELNRLSGGQPSTELTESERGIAELAGSGLTNRQIATQLYVSEKTVEANLSRVYRKLGIRSRAELVRVMRPAPS
ncbi:helix-turn-helix transcriptional regulator [Mycobacterium sp. PS03-16]|uniref:helix-turn-helix transcriptional regulator n=1 Tax=Mycobacterium sp. PS03-16 TaxID=2559611 RepID=UPI0010733B2C|nr:LuxR family transcriptional regulator [Mycobacterium sp. PS03-16]TFV59193.1 helix-turn-helix transcriptional regulator [Mycobacterium sp. PS03-16]